MVLRLQLVAIRGRLHRHLKVSHQKVRCLHLLACRHFSDTSQTNLLLRSDESVDLPRRTCSGSSLYLLWKMVMDNLACHTPIFILINSYKRGVLPDQ